LTDVVIRAKSVEATPAGYQVPGAQEILIRSVRAEIDGTNAAGEFTATLQLLAPDGDVVWQAPLDSTTAAGASVTPTWFPRVGAGVGIRFDTYPQAGDWLYVQTTGDANIPGSDAGGMFLDDTGGGGIIIRETTDGGINLDDGRDSPDSNTGGINLHEWQDGGISFESDGNGGVIMADNGNPGGGIEIKSERAGIDILANESGVAAGGDLRLDGGEGNILMTSLPNSDPGVTGALWNNGGVVNVS
jgi:hypothetical protein